MPLSLAEQVVAATEPLKKGVILGLVQESAILDLMTPRSTGALHIAGVRYDNDIEPDWVPSNGTIAEKSTRGKNLSFGVYKMALHLDIDVALQNDQGVIERPASRQAKMLVIGTAKKINYTFVNGDQGADPNGFDGIEKIIGNLAASQSVGATELDISGAPTDAVIQSVIDRMDTAIHAINGHRPDFALINATTGLRLRSCFRRANLLGTTEDWIKNGMPFGNIRQSLKTAATKPMFMYQNIPFFDIGERRGAAIMLNTYTEGGSTGTGSRIYFVKASSEDAELLQYAAPKFQPIGLLENKDTERTRFTQTLGLGVWRGDSLAKVQGIRVA